MRARGTRAPRRGRPRRSAASTRGSAADAWNRGPGHISAFTLSEGAKAAAAEEEGNASAGDEWRAGGSEGAESHFDDCVWQNRAIVDYP
jgi:hypothetical protein